MGLISLSQILSPAINQPWAVGAYDVVNIAMCDGVINAANQEKAPTILLIYPKSVPEKYFSTFCNYIKAEADHLAVDLAIVLDHGTSINSIKLAIDIGFTGVMFDGSMLPFEENIAATSEVVRYAHPRGVSVEAELGHVGEGFEVISPSLREKLYTDPSKVVEFVEKTNVDALAISIGTAHGVYHFEPELDINRLVKIRKQVEIALVLHGSSGTPEDQIKAAIETGIDKVNVYTDIRLSIVNRIKELINSPEYIDFDVIDIDKIIKETTEQVVKNKNHLFGSTGKAK